MVHSSTFCQYKIVENALLKFVVCEIQFICIGLKLYKSPLRNDLVEKKKKINAPLK